MYGLKTLVGAAVLLAGLAMAPAVQAQIVVNIGVQPSCAYGYYGYAPYRCAPKGYYGPGYFYNGIFLGMGPWGGWGYSHGWGSHRFAGEGGGRYHGGPGKIAYHAHIAQAHGNSGGARPSAAHPAPKRAPAQHAAAPRHGPSPSPAAHGKSDDQHNTGGDHK